METGRDNRVVNEVEKRQLTWLEHVNRMRDTTWPKNELKWISPEK